MKHDFKQLKIWQKGMDITDDIYVLSKQLPLDERFNLIDQMNRSSCSVPINIAEGCGKRSKLQFAEYLSTALTSSYELQTQLLICQRRKYGNPKLLDKILLSVDELQKMIFSFRDKIINE